MTDSTMLNIVDYMKSLKIPVNRENFISFISDGRTESGVGLDPEIESMLPDNLQSTTGSPLMEPGAREESTVTQKPLQTFTTGRGTELVAIGTYSLGSKSGDPPYSNTALLVPEAADAFAAMNSKYREEGDGDLVLESAYRNFEHNKKVGGEETPGYHMEGIAIDVTHKKSRAWILKHGEKFGFYFHDYISKKSGLPSNHFNYGVKRDDSSRFIDPRTRKEIEK